MPQNTAEAWNMRLLAHHDLDGFGNGGEGVALQSARDGRRIFYIAHESGPKDFTALDVTDPKDPRLVAQTELQYPNVRSNSLDLVDDTLVVAYQSGQTGVQGVGMAVFDVSDPANPRKVSFFDMSGPTSRGAHYVWFADGRYAHLSTGAPDFEPSNPRDDQFYMIVDLSDPASPREAGRWWLPGTRKGDPEPPPARHTTIDAGFRPHNINVYPERPDRAYVAYLDGGAIILDISDMARPKMLGRMDYHPPFPGFTHTMMPLFDRGLAIVTDEATSEDLRDHPKLTWVMDIREETNPVIISTFPMPDVDDYGHRPGRYGSHNIHENKPGPVSWRSDRHIVGAYFNTGVRVYDISDPFRPEVAAYYIPPSPEGVDGININDVYVDENGVVYALDRKKGGVYILEMDV